MSGQLPRSALKPTRAATDTPSTHDRAGSGLHGKDAEYAKLVDVVGQFDTTLRELAQKSKRAAELAEKSTETTALFNSIFRNA